MTMPDLYRETECLIIGTGIAGATCAYIAAK